MAKEKRSFSELLGEAPLAAQEDTVSLVGALERSHQKGKFVLALGPGRSVTLDVEAVKGHQVLGGGVGQILVQVDVDRESVPEEIKGAFDSPFTHFGYDVPITISYLDHPHKLPHVDIPFTIPTNDFPSPKNILEASGTIQENIGDPGFGGDPWQWGGGFGGPVPGAGAPFALATPHQAPQSTIAAMQMRGPVRGPTHYSDLTSPLYDKRPTEDISTPGFQRIYD